MCVRQLTLTHTVCYCAAHWDISLGVCRDWWAPTLLIICHLMVYQSQRILSCLCERWIFLFYGLINFTWIISLHTDPCFDKCSRWITHTMCFLLLLLLLRPTASHHKHGAPHHITQMCFVVGVRHSITAAVHELLTGTGNNIKCDAERWRMERPACLRRSGEYVQRRCSHQEEDGSAAPHYIKQAASE